MLHEADGVIRFHEPAGNTLVGLGMKLRNVVLAVICVAIAPATWVFVSDLYVGLVAPGDDEGARQEARLILWRDVLRERSRMLETSFLGPARSGNAKQLPVITLRMPAPPPLSQALPTCPGYVISAEKPDTEYLFRAGSIPALFPMRGETAEDRANFLHASKLSVSQLAVLDACFQATPFGPQCSRWLSGREPGRDEVLQKLVQDDLVARQGRSHCWQLPEVRFTD